MGRDKALIRLGDGMTLVEGVAAALRTAGATEVLVVGGHQNALAALGLQYVPDRFPGEGPLGGIVTALGAASQPCVAVLACDHVTPSAAGVSLVVEALGSCDVAIPVVAGRRQTLHAAWRREARHKLLGRFLDGARSVRQGIEGLATVEVQSAHEDWFQDADTPDELPNHHHGGSGQ